MHNALETHTHWKIARLYQLNINITLVCIAKIKIFRANNFKEASRKQQKKYFKKQSDGKSQIFQEVNQFISKTS